MSGGESSAWSKGVIALCVIGALAVVGVLVILLGIGAYQFRRRWRRKQKLHSPGASELPDGEILEKGRRELPAELPEMHGSCHCHELPG